MLSSLDFKSVIKYDSVYGIPFMKSQRFPVKEVMGFNYCLSKRELTDKAIHFFLDDYQFERVWNKPARYVKILKEFSGCFSTDFSLYRNDPYPVQLYNIYRNRLLGRYWQEAGISVIPVVGWGDAGSYDFCFLGIRKGSWVAISTRGAIHRKEDREFFIEGYNEMLKVIAPEKIFIYGRELKGLKGNIEWLPWDYYRNEKLGG